MFISYFNLDAIRAEASSARPLHDASMAFLWGLAWPAHPPHRAVSCLLSCHSGPWLNLLQVKCHVELVEVRAVGRC